MSVLMDVTHYLSKVIGPRPTGTEEEQQAALYITEQFQRETGFSANIEEFQRTTRPDLSFAILGSIVALVALLSIFFPAISIPAFIIIVLVGGVYVLETFGHPLLSHVLAKGASQNVIAKYQPNLESGSNRSVTRKLILVAHYDSGHVTPSLVKRLDSGKIAFNVIESVVMAVLAFLGLIRIFVAITGGGALIILNVITVIAVLIALLPLVRFVLINNAPYNEGANNNASGSAALIEIARRISQGSVNENDLINMAENVVIHGEDAAFEAGLVPEGAEISYEAAATGPLGAAVEVEETDGSEEDRLLAAKAAIAALTGRPVENRLYVTPVAETAQEDGREIIGTGDVVTQIAGDAEQPADDMAQEGIVVEESVDASPSAASQDIAAVQPEKSAPSTDEVSSEIVGVQAVEEAEPAPEPMSISAYFAAANAEANGGQPMPNLSAASFAPQAQEGAETVVVPAATEVVAAATNVVEEESVAGFQNVPSWFAAAQKNAKRSDKQTEVQRSRFTEALENAEHERIARETAQLAEEMERMEAERLEREAEARARIEAQQQQIEAAKAAEEEAAQAAAEVEQAQTAAEQIEGAIAVEAPIPGMDEDATQAQTPAHDQAQEQTQTQAQTQPQAQQSADNDLLQQALDYKAAQEAESNASATRSMTLPTIASPEMVTSAVEAAGNRQERLMNLRTNVPSLSGVIRTKDAARRAAVESLSSKLGTTEFTAQSSLSQETTVMPMSPAETSILPQATPLREAPAARSLQAVSGGRSLSSIPSPADNVAASPANQEVDYDMVLSGYDEFGSYQEDFAGGYSDTFEGDFASNLFNEEEYADDFNADLTPSYNYGEYDNAFLDDDDFAAEQKPKRKGFFSRLLHRKEEEEMDSPQQWLGVDDDFDAPSVGRARGGWESFRQDFDDVDDPFNDDNFDDFGDFGDEYNSRSRGSRWEGGSYSRMSLGHVDMRSGVDTEADMTIPDTPPEAEKDRFITGEIERIYHFRNPAFNTEIWFVAMGCDDASHDGVRAFIAEHKTELRGSMIIEIESMGAGALSVAKREGATKKISASSRIKRYTREAVAATGIALDEVDMSGTESIASIIQKAGFQSMHLFGAENGRPALKGSADDVFENIDELVFDENTRFVYELLKR